MLKPALCVRVLRRTTWGLAVILLLAAAAVLPSQSAGEPVTTENFEGPILPDWNLDPTWDVGPAEGSNTLQGSGHAWATLNTPLPQDLLVQFRLRLQSGAALHANLRFSTPTRYFIGLREDGTYIARQTGAQDFQHDLASAAGLGSGWHVIQMAAAGNTVRVAVDGKQVMAWQDPNPLTGTQIAFESLENNIVWIDDLMVYAFDAAQPFPMDLPATLPAAPAAAPLPTMPPLPASSPQAAATLPQVPAVPLLDDPSWVYTGGPLGGLGYDVRMRPDNPDVLFVTDAKAGIFKSTDGGEDWSASNSGITTRTGETNELIPIFSVTIDPNNPDIVWAGTQFQGGVYKSTDGGDTWKKMVNGIRERDLTVRGFGVDPRDSNTVYFAAEVSSWEWAGSPRNGREFDLVKGVVYKSTDGGANWAMVWSGDNLARYMLIDPRDSNVVYISTGIFDREAANSDPQAGTPGGVGVLKSTDGGQTWTAMSNGMDNLYVGSLFMHPEDPDVLLAGAGNITYQSGGGIYLTSDGAQSWTRTYSAYVIGAVEFAASDPQVAYAGNNDLLLRSEDGGRTWGRLNSSPGWGSSGTPAGHPIDFQVDPRDPYRLFSNQYGGGNFLSEDGGETWQAASRGYTGAMVRSVVADPSQPGQVIAGGRSGLFITYNGGSDWQGITRQPFYTIDWNVVAMDPADPQHILAGLTCEQQLIETRDGGATWKKVLAETHEKAAVTSIDFAPADTSTVFASTGGFISCGSYDHSLPGNGLYLSRDGGRKWLHLDEPQFEGLAFNRVAVNPQNGMDVFAAPVRRGLLRSLDGGQTWSQVGGGLSANHSISELVYDPTNSATLLAGRSQGGILRSTDGGSSWLNSGAGMPNEATMTSIVFDANRPGVVYAADLFSGVYRSRDGGATWKALNSGLNVRAVDDLALSSDGQHLYAGTEGNGVYRLDLAGQPPEAALQPTAVPQTPPTLIPTSAAAGPTEETPSSGDGGGFPFCSGLFLPIPLVVLLLGWRRIFQ